MEARRFLKEGDPMSALNSVMEAVKMTEGEAGILRVLNEVRCVQKTRFISDSCSLKNGRQRRSTKKSWRG